jgi:hypothetical protein
MVKAIREGALEAAGGLYRPEGHRPEGQAHDPLSAANMMRLVTDLAVRYKDRVFGTFEGYVAGQYLRDEMIRLGLKPANGDSYWQRFELDLEDHKRTGQNVLGLIEGTDPVLKNEYVIVSAHYDVVQNTHEGANDNATGCAGVLAIAEALKKNPPKRTVVFMTFDGEEGLSHKGNYFPGRKGSRFYASHPIFPIEKTAMLVNMDELGKAHLETKSRDLIYQWASSDPFAKRILERATEKTNHLGKSLAGYPEQPEEAQFFTTDAEPLYRLGVPIINLLSGRYFLNHTPKDDMSIMLPARMEQYVRRAYQCVVEAANDPTPLEAMGVVPGGLMPTYPLIRERKGAGQAVPEEEARRLSSIYARAPMLKDVADRAIEILEDPLFRRAVEQKTGFDIGPAKDVGTEDTLARVRDARKALVGAYRAIPKNNLELRREKQGVLEILGGIEGVLAGGIYVRMFTGGDYFTQQMPSALLDLRLGAIRLGRSDLADKIPIEDTKPFKTSASLDRAVALAKEALPGLQRALSQAVFALVDPSGAKDTERAIEDHDLVSVFAKASSTAEAKLGKARDEDAERKQISLIFAFLSASLGSVKASSERWARKFADANVLQDFVGFVAQLDLTGDDRQTLDRLAHEVEANIEAGEIGRLEETVVAFYGALTEIAGGEGARARSMTSLMALSRNDVREKAEKAALERERDAVDPTAIAKERSDPEVARHLDLAKLVKDTLGVRALFAKTSDDRIVLKDEVTLATLKAAIDAVRKDAEAYRGAEGIAGELEFWSRWMSPYLALEPAARAQAKARREAAAAGLDALFPLWKDAKEKVDPELRLSKSDLGSPEAVCRALEKKIRRAEDDESRDVRAEAALKKFAPIKEAKDALATLTGFASPGARARATDAIAQLSNQFGDEAVRLLVETDQRLSAAWAGAEIDLGRKERSGPMGVLKVRAENRPGASAASLGGPV